MKETIKAKTGIKKGKTILRFNVGKISFSMLPLQFLSLNNFYLNTN